MPSRIGDSARESAPVTSRPSTNRSGLPAATDGRRRHVRVSATALTGVSGSASRRTSALTS